VYAPISGLITEVNDELPNSPEVINEDCYGDGWMVRMRPTVPDEMDDLLSAEEYEELINELS
jgi:glycine cleavage system H protein